VISMDDGAFAGCRGLTSITSLALSPPTLYGDVFYEVTACLYVPSVSSKANYSSAGGWSDFSCIEALDNTVTVTFNAGTGGTVTPTSGTTGADGKLAAPSSLPTPTKASSIFNGWYTAATGGDKVEDDYVYSKNTTVYAQWIPVYTITFNAGTGGTVTPASGTTGADGTLATPSSLPTPTKANSIFNGWYTAATGGDKVEEDYVYSKNTPVYAQWTPVYTVTFNAGTGGTVTPASGTTGADGKLAAPSSLPKPTRTGYDFNGWFTAATGGTQVTAGTVFTANTTVYAQWTVAKYTVTYDINGGAIRRNITVALRDSYTYPGSDGWNGASLRISVNGIDLPTNATIEAGSSGTYTFNANTEDRVNFYWNSGGTFDIECAFAVYYTGTTLSPAFDPASDAENNEEVLLLYRQYGSLSNTATGTRLGSFVVVGEISAQTVEHGKNVTLAGGNDLSKRGYTFAGWNTDAFGTGTNYNAGSTFTPSATVTLYARWKLDTYTVTFDARGGVVSPASGTTGNGWKLASLPTPTKPDDKFEGWYTAEADGEKITTATPFSENTTIYARWKSENISVLTPAREIPTVKPDEEATAAAPVSQLTGEFTAGPNPVNRQLGNVGFFRQGKRIASGELRIYDATGNVVGKVKIVDKAIDSQARRQVGSWDLADVNGRPVSEGTYLVKGVLKTSDGKKEKVSVIVGVR